jgi:hypothetical protein
MINNSTSLVRKLKEFFDKRIGLYSWDRVRITHFGQEEDDEYEYVAVEFDHAGKRFAIQAVSTEDAPPLGKIELRAMQGSQRVSGALSDETFGRMQAVILAI